MKKVSIALLAIALIGCSTDDDKDASKNYSSGVVSCDYIMTKGNYPGARECDEMPIEENYGFDKAECEEMNGTWSNGCPAGSVIVCPWKKALLYYYDEMFRGLTCGEIFADDEVTEPELEN